jgi:hypothetical protein
MQVHALDLNAIFTGDFVLQCQTTIEAAQIAEQQPDYLSTFSDLKSPPIEFRSQAPVLPQDHMPLSSRSPILHTLNTAIRTSTPTRLCDGASARQRHETQILMLTQTQEAKATLKNVPMSLWIAHGPFGANRLLSRRNPLGPPVGKEEARYAIGVFSFDNSQGEWPIFRPIFGSDEYPLRAVVVFSPREKTLYLHSLVLSMYAQFLFECLVLKSPIYKDYAVRHALYVNGTLHTMDCCVALTNSLIPHLVISVRYEEIARQKGWSIEPWASTSHPGNPRGITVARLEPLRLAPNAPPPLGLGAQGQHGNHAGQGRGRGRGIVFRPRGAAAPGGPPPAGY